MPSALASLVRSLKRRAKPNELITVMPVEMDFVSGGTLVNVDFQLDSPEDDDDEVISCVFRILYVSFALMVYLLQCRRLLCYP